MTEPSPFVQACVYMSGVLVGYVLLTHPDEWQRAREAIQEFLGKKQ
jgi:hypothetical protein